jgi:hypothetical protein
MAAAHIQHTTEELIMTPDQMFESFRKASMSSLQLQQEVFKQFSQQWPMPATAPGGAPEWVPQFQKRWAEFASDSLTRSRESLETMYKLALEMVALTSRVYESKTPEEYRAGVEEARVKVFDTIKDQSDTQLREFQKTAEKWFDVFNKA